MQELIELIQAGELSHNQILQHVTVIHNKNCVELDTAMDRIEELESIDTLNRLEIIKCKELLNTSIATTQRQEEAIKIIEKNALIAVSHAQDFQNKLVIAEAKVELFNKNKGELKKVKPQVKRLKQANINSTKRNIRHMQEKKVLKLERDKAYLEIAKLNMTGFKKVGKYTFSIFPVKVNTETGARKIGLAVCHDEGSYKVFTRDAEGTVLQPKSHTFRFNQEETAFMDNFFNVVEAHDHVFTNDVLRLVK